MNITAWTPEKVDILRKLYSDHLNADIAKQLGVSVHAVDSQARNLRLRKSPDFISQLNTVKARANTQRYRNPGKQKLDYAPIQRNGKRYISKTGTGGVGQ